MFGVASHKSARMIGNGNLGCSTHDLVLRASGKNPSNVCFVLKIIAMAWPYGAPFCWLRQEQEQNLLSTSITMSITVVDSVFRSHNFGLDIR